MFLQDDAKNEKVILDPPNDPGDLNNPPGTGADEDDFEEDLEEEANEEEIEEDEDK